MNAHPRPGISGGPRWPKPEWALFRSASGKAAVLDSSGLAWAEETSTLNRLPRSE